MSSASPPSPVVHLCRGREFRGGERQVRILVRALQAGGAGDQELLTAAGAALALATRGELAVHEAPWTTALDPRAVTALFRRCRRAPRPALLHAHDSHALMLALAAGSRYRIPVVATRRSVTRPGLLWRRPARVIAISGAVERALREGGVRPERISPVASAVNLTELAAARTTPAAPPTIVSAGALTREKGHATLLAAFARLGPAAREARLVLVGDGPLRGALLRQAAGLGLGERVVLNGGWPDAVPWLAAATAVVQPSLREALGTAVLEAMALGVPVVASETGGLIELLRDGAGLLVPPGDAAALAAALERLLADRGLRSRLTAAAAERVQDYDVPRMADRVAQVYRSVHCTP